MEITVKTGDVLHESSDLAILASFSGAHLPTEASGLLELDDFQGSARQTLLLYPRGAAAPRRLLLVGLGKREGVTTEVIRQAAAIAVQKAQELKVSAITIGINGDFPLSPEESAQAFAEGIELGAYRYWQRSSGSVKGKFSDVAKAIIFAKDVEKAKKGIAAGQAIARGVMLARNLVNAPGGELHPPELGDEALRLGKQFKLKVTVLKMAQLTAQGFGGILAVGKGSEHEPRFIVMEYGQPAKGIPTICLVGKGLTFDSGGLSLKPADAMETMKSDMGGAAAVFGAMQVVAELKLPLHVVGLVSSAENMPSSNAYRPGDIVKTLSGKTVEVLNTDAEGRIILSDALFYAQSYKPDVIINLATLTGAIIIALGNNTTGLMGTDPVLVEKLKAAGEVTGERVWELPLWDEYREMNRSQVADVKNLAGRPAGSITAAAFLAEFVGDYPFAHLDIAGSAWAAAPSKPYQTHGGTGVGVRLLAEFLQKYK